MRTETILLPNPNQLILLRELQKEFCSVPALPLCLKCPKLNGLKDKISKAEPSGLFIEDRRLFLRVEMTVNGKCCEGRIELGDYRLKSDNDSGEEPSFSCLTRKTLPFKKLSPFRIVKIETEDFENGKKWNVLEEKWGKV